MASSVLGFGGEVGPVVGQDVVQEVYPGVTPQVTREVIDEAFEAVFGAAPNVHADAVRRLMVSDVNSEITQAYFVDLIRNNVRSSFSSIYKPEIVVSEVLTKEEVQKVVDYGAGYQLTFKGNAVHDHPLASACRRIDRNILSQNIPPNRRYLDIGGNPLYHVRHGDTNCVTVAPYDVDSKDAMRESLAMMELEMIVDDARSDEIQRNMAADILRNGGHYLVRQTAQSVCTQAEFSISCHVYDVPLPEWPKMMERCGIMVHEGCVHFSNRFFAADSGTLPHSGSYYEIDQKADVFRMRIGTSHSAWYQHKWSDYMRYGANQVLRTQNYKYSYQIIERRHDTIFFRILRVGPGATANADQVYALPDVPMMEVRSFEVLPNSGASNRRRKQLLRKTYYFPVDLWEMMYAFAGSELERGALSYEKLYNYYRTVVPRQTINGVLVSGGQKVPMDDVPALVVSSATSATVDAYLRQKSMRARTDAIQAERGLMSEWTIFKVLRLFYDGLVATLMLPLSPFAALPKAMSSAYSALLGDMMVHWAPQVQLRSINAALIIDTRRIDYNYAMPASLQFAQVNDERMLAQTCDLMRHDPDMAKRVLQLCGSALPKQLTASLASVSGDVSDDTSVTAVQHYGTTTLVREGKTYRRTVQPPEPESRMIADRRSAIAEAIKECEVETAALTSKCKRIYDTVVINGAPQEKVLRSRCDELFNADLWRVSQGILIESVLDPKMRDVSHSGVFVPMPNSDGSYLLPVLEDVRDITTPDGRLETKTYYRVDTEFCGYVMVLDPLKIFNGPAIADALRVAMAMPSERFRFNIVCHQGPAGCGKTTTIVRESDPEKDLYLVPTRLAAQAIRDKISAKYDISGGVVRRRVATLDSYLMHYTRYNQQLDKPQCVRVDEYVLARYGKWVAAMVLANVSSAHAYGDNFQIKHTPRVDVATFFLDMKYQVLEEEFITYRCAPMLLACFNFVYNYEVRSARSDRGQIEVVRNLRDVQWLPDARLLSMYQADKKVLQTFSRSVDTKPVVSTVHEAQGTDCDHVVLYNSEMRKRSADEAAFYLYAQRAYCLVAISRARKKFTYVKLSREQDLITEMLEKAGDPRRVTAASDVKSAGTSIEFA